MSKLVLIDGHSILNRAFYGVPLLTNTKGMHINALYGFLNILFKILDEENPDYLCVAFDRSEKTFRHDIYPEYKGTRKPMPDELHEQVLVIKEILAAMKITTCEKPGLEADDILGTLAKRAQNDGVEVSLISGDRDLLQIATDHIKIRIPKTKGNKTEVEDYYAKDVVDKYQVDPLTFIDLKALMGDTSDNIPGVPKIGEKTASALLVEYGSLDGVYEHVEEISKPAIKNSLIENKDLAYLSKTLATINIDADIPISYIDAVKNDLFNKEAYELFISLGFKKFLDKFDPSSMAQVREDANSKLINDFAECEKVFESFEKEETIAFSIDTEEREVVSVSVALQDCVYVFVVSGFMTQDYLCDKLHTLALKKNLICFDVKDVYRYIGTDIKDMFDMKIAAYLVNPLKSDYSIADIAQEYLEAHLPSEKDIFGKMSLSEAVFIDCDKYQTYAANKTDVLIKSYEQVFSSLNDKGMLNLYNEIELPLTKVLFHMENEGILVDKDALKAYGESLTGRIKELEEAIYKQAGLEFNINSPKQLGEILFDKMGLEGGKKTKNGYSTSAEVLEKLAVDVPFVNDILEYRGLVKLKSTYAEGLYDCIREDGRIHTTFNQTITATGRISSTEPNLQNIPMRMELGRKIRQCFIPKPGYVFIDADYSQIELRVLAHMAGDKELIESYKTDADIHRITASKVFHIPPEEVTDLQRRNAKAVNFGIVYGISSFGLSRDLSISRKEAKQYIEDYFKTYTGIKAYLDGCVENAKRDGYVDTLYGRRRPIPELSSSNFMTRSFGERVAMNSPIQGTAADIMKIAMIKVNEALADNQIDGAILIQVHDELLLEVNKEQAEQARELLCKCMSEAADLAVRLEVDVHEGNNWYEAK